MLFRQCPDCIPDSPDTDYFYVGALGQHNVLCIVVGHDAFSQPQTCSFIHTRGGSADCAYPSGKTDLSECKHILRNDYIFEAADKCKRNRKVGCRLVKSETADYIYICVKS